MSNEADNGTNIPHEAFLQHLATFMNNLILGTMKIEKEKISSLQKQQAEEDKVFNLSPSSSEASISEIPPSVPYDTDKKEANTTEESFSKIYPNGNTCFSLPKSISEPLISPVFGWKMMTHNTKRAANGRKLYRTCLGVFQCPECDFLASPLQKDKKTKNALLKPPKRK